MTTTIEQLTEQLPALQGSEKQIRWAEEIRCEELEAAWKFFVKASDAAKIRRADLFLAGKLLGEESDQIDRVMAAMETAITEMASQAEARWWIDHRGECVLAIRAAGKAAM